MTDSLATAQDCLQILSVNLKGCNICIADELEVSELQSEEAVHQSFRTVTKVTEVELDKKGSMRDQSIWRNSFDYSVGVRLISKEDEELSLGEEVEPLLQIEAQFIARYISEQKMAADTLEAFSSENVGYHVWPYWREFVQSSCARIGMEPPVSIPFYRIRRKDKA